MSKKQLVTELVTSKKRHTASKSDERRVTSKELIPIKEALKSLLALILLAGFLELLLPDDKMRKYGQMVVGLIVLFSMINMMVQVSRDLALQLPGGERLAQPAPEILVANGLNLRRRGEEEDAQLTAGVIQGEVEKFLQQITGGKEVRVELPPAAKKGTQPVRVVIPADAGVPVAFLKRTVAAILSAPVDQVEVEVEGEEGQS